ncbi:DoxX family protein [Fodinicola acaciae]|uniref:DoxX family protein n=1 Tax=Fodinicola acaciae TaxID=2681555 RepID=UPI0013D77167|nr:DoxX family protein [Fodinicola acaciae]
MSIAYVLVTVVTIVANAGVAIADLSKASFVLRNSTELDLPAWSVLPLGLLKAAGAAGLMLGLIGLRPLGIAAATGLVLFFVGAVAIHIRKRVFHNIAAPTAFLLLAVGSLATATWH